jgi:hypothetical protein
MGFSVAMVKELYPDVLAIDIAYGVIFLGIIISYFVVLLGR